jgi:hypothetical protein
MVKTTFALLNEHGCRFTLPSPPLNDGRPDWWCLLAGNHAPWLALAARQVAQ